MGAAPESRQQIHSDREILHSLYKCVVVLLCQNCSGHQIHHLFPLLYRFKSSADCNFSLSIAYISTDQTIHDLVTFHIRFCGFNGCQLVFCFLIGKHLLKFSLPYCIFSESISFRLLPDSVKFYQIPGHFTGSFLCLILSLCPLLGSQFVQLWLPCVSGSILLYHIKTGCQDIKIAAIAVLNLDIIFDYFVYLNLFNTLINSQSVIFMNHIISDLQFRKVIDFSSFVLFFLFLFFLFCSENIAFGNHRKFQQRIFKTFQYSPVKGHDLPRLYFPIGVFRIKSSQIIFTEIPGQSCSTSP